MLEHIEAVNWPNFSVAVSKGTGRPQERTRTGEWLVSGMGGHGRYLPPVLPSRVAASPVG